MALGHPDTNAVAKDSYFDSGYEGEISPGVLKNTDLGSPDAEMNGDILLHEVELGYTGEDFEICRLLQGMQVKFDRVAKWLEVLKGRNLPEKKEQAILRDMESFSRKHGGLKFSSPALTLYLEPCLTEDNEVRQLVKKAHKSLMEVAKSTVAINAAEAGVLYDEYWD